MLFFFLVLSEVGKFRREIIIVFLTIDPFNWPGEGEKNRKKGRLFAPFEFHRNRSGRKMSRFYRFN